MEGNDAEVARLGSCSEDQKSSFRDFTWEDGKEAGWTKVNGVGSCKRTGERRRRGYLVREKDVVE